MQIIFATEALRKACNEQRRALKKWGERRASLVFRRLVELASVPRLSDMLTMPGHCHELIDDRKGQLAVNLDGGYRLIFEPANEPVPQKPDGGIDWASVTAIRVLEVRDYHG